ncbi:histidine kinase-, DNA gyrase B-, and HSP90-like ATPase family protein [Tanacetum coccineum]
MVDASSTDKESQSALPPLPLMAQTHNEIMVQNSPQKSIELQPQSSTHPQLNSKFKCSVEAGVCESQSLITAMDRGIMENENQGHMMGNVEQSDIYSEIYQRVKVAVHHEAQGGLPNPLKINSYYPLDNLNKKDNNATTQISTTMGINNSATSLVFSNVLQPNTIMETHAHQTSCSQPPPNPTQDGSSLLHTTTSVHKSKTNKLVECHPIRTKAQRFAKIIQDKKSSLKCKERDKTKVLVRNSGKSKEKSKKRICKETNEDFIVSPHSHEHLTEFEDGEDDDEYQNNLNLIGASLGITLDGKLARPITDVQNAVKNLYPCDVEATLTFIFQENGVIVLNNDEGFSAESIKALCDDVCNMKKKEPSGDRYIDNKGIGLKSVFRFSDAPEIHSNEFNIKFNISDGLATSVPPRDVSLFSKMVYDEKLWNTCMVLPKKNEAFVVKDIIFIFRKLHPHVMLFLHRLKCIKYIDLVHGSSVVMKKEVFGDGMVNIFSNVEKATWFFKKFRLQANHVQQDVQTTEISMALMLEDSNNGNYTPHLYPQLVFAFLRPIGYYGFNFIIQADLVDAESPWNQWLLSEFPNVFVSAELSFCSLPCFRENPARGVSVFLSFVPFEEDVYGEGEIWLLTNEAGFEMFGKLSPSPKFRIVDPDLFALQIWGPECKWPVDVPIHFGKEFGNPVDMNKLVGGTNMKWYEIDIGYLKHPVYKSTPKGTLRRRKFLQKLGVTDFVQVLEVEKRSEDIEYTSPELMHLLSHVTTHGDKEKSKYLLKVLNTLWDDHFSSKPYRSYVIRMLHGDPWMASSMDDRLHFPKDLFHNCQVVRTVLGQRAPYTVPKVSSVKFLNDIGLKKTVTLDDALSILEVWRGSKIPFRASISQLSKFYTYLWNEMGFSKRKIVKKLHSQAFIFVPHSFSSTHEVVSGSFLSPSEVYWHDSFRSIEQTKSIHPLLNKMLCNAYPGRHNFFVNEFGVAENPPFLSYLQSLLQLSAESLPSQAAKTFFHVLRKWSDGLDSWVLSSEDIDHMKKSMEKMNMRIFPTVQNRWVSLHQSFGLLSNKEKQMLRDKVSVLLRRLGIPSLSEVVTREAIYDNVRDNTFLTYFINWAIPHAQRYINSFHRKKYSEFKNLKIVVVEKLFYKNIIKKFGIESNKRLECSCLLQDKILYATPEYDSYSHSLFMELSRFLVVEVPELPLANFLHRILTTESGYVEEQMELFLTNKQKLLKLPCEESEWSMYSISSPEEDKLTPTTNSGFSLDVLSLTESTSKKLQRRSRKPASCLEYASNTKEVNSDQTRHDEASVIRKEEEVLKDQLSSGIYKDIVSSDTNDGFTSNERELVALNSEKRGKRWVKKVKEFGSASDFVTEGKDNSNEKESAEKIIKCIRREEFGLGSDISATEKDSILKKQHSRLGEALHRLSEELYSQDSHFVLELVRNADENMYLCDVEPTLTFILQETGVIVLNNDQGFSVETIKALCKVGNSSKTEPSTGYISKKGIGFKSAFQVTDAPEIHSNGFHVKFDISDGHIGFVLPTVVPPCNVDLFSKLISGDNDPTDETCWKTCIVLPFRSKEDEAFPVEKLISMFSSFHPSLLLFLHRLKCIKFRNIPNDSLIVMRKQVDKDGIMKVFLGKENFTWFVKSRTLQAGHICHDVQTTEISVALMLENLGNGNYISKLDQQPVFALFSSRSYGLKFIIQADFIVSSSREEVDMESMVVNGVSKVVREVHGFFSQLPHMIISKLCSSSCLLLQGEDNEWVTPCKVLLNWTEETRLLLPDSLIRDHLDVGYLHKDTLLTDSLARALGIEECGPEVLIQVMASLYQADSLKSMGLGWLSSWLNVKFGCILPEHGLEAFGKLYSELRIVNPAPFSDHVKNITQMLYKVGVQRLFAHEVLKKHVLWRKVWN